MIGSRARALVVGVVARRRRRAGAQRIAGCVRCALTDSHRHAPACACAQRCVLLRKNRVREFRSRSSQQHVPPYVSRAAGQRSAVVWPMALAALRQWALRSPWAGLLAPKGKGRQGEQGGTTWDEDVQATLAALVTRAEGRPPEDPRAKRAMCFSTALEMKFSGNSSFKKGAYADAASAYERGLDALEILTQIGVDAVR